MENNRFFSFWSEIIDQTTCFLSSNFDKLLISNFLWGSTCKKIKFLVKKGHFLSKNCNLAIFKRKFIKVLEFFKNSGK